jgi:hypothetical protein
MWGVMLTRSRKINQSMHFGSHLPGGIFVLGTCVAFRQDAIGILVKI